MNSIDHNTSSNVVVRLELASIVSRVFAFIIDCVAYGFCMLILTFLILRLSASEFSDFDFPIPIVMLYIFSFLAYFILSEYFLHGQTLGKYILKIRVIKIDNTPITFESYVIRGLFLLIDYIFSIGSLGLLVSISSSNKQRIGDFIARTIVVNTNKNSLFTLKNIREIETLSTAEIIYKNADNLNNDQAIVIKKILSAKHLEYLDRKTINETALKISEIIQQEPHTRNSIEFLKTVLHDYVILTR